MDVANADLMSIGVHCSVDHCGQLDFLPFTCDCCQRVYCLDHRSYAAHACSQAGSKQTEVIVCPICAKSVRITPGQDPNLLFDQHTRTDCDPANYAKVHKKPKCPVTGCKEKLTTINTYRCKDCSQRVCLKHRHPDDHKCSEHKAAPGGNPLGRLQTQRPASAALAATAPSAAAPPPAAARPAPRPRPDPQAVRSRAMEQYADPTNSVRGTAARRMPGSGAASNVNPLVPPHRPETCPQCGASFATVERLIQHVEDFHPSGATSSGQQQQPTQQHSAAQPSTAAGGSAPIVRNPLQGLLGSTIAGGSAPAAASSGAPRPDAGMPLFGGSAARQAGAGSGGQESFRCHFCSQTFHDPVLLLQHSERCATARAAAGGSRGSSAKDSCTMS